jgi:hypothetical protein
MPDSRKPRDARELLLDTLLEKVANERFPSVSMLDLIESLLRPDEVQIYVRILLRKVRRETYPSIPMLRRIAALAR